MFQIEVAGLVVRIDNQYEYVKDLCGDYLTSSDRLADISVSVSEEELQRELKESPTAYFSEGYAEGVMLYEKISNALPAFDAFVMHSSVVAVDGQAYCFAAESGMGKSTQTRYWKQVLGEGLTIINGDKPIYRFHGDHLIAYGTPWCGKENWQTNAGAPLRALCLLQQREENAIFPVKPSELLAELTRHFYLPGGDLVDLLKVMKLIDKMISMVPVYRLCCKNDVSAAEMAISYFGLGEHMAQAD